MSETPEILYHYTSLDAFLSILNSAAFRGYTLHVLPGFSTNADSNKFKHVGDNKYIWNGEQLFCIDRNTTILVADKEKLEKASMNLLIKSSIEYFYSLIKIAIETNNFIILNSQQVALFALITGYKPQKTAVVRLMSHKAMNDSSELRVHDDVIKEAFNKVEQANSDKRKEIDEIQKACFMCKSLDAFFFCLSERFDILTQWRLYADDTFGVAIGFSPSEFYLKNIDNSLNSHIFNNEKFSPTEMLYEEEIIRDNIEKIIETEIAYIGKRRHPLAIGAQIFKKTLSFKDSSFRSEKEWRYISCAANALEQFAVKIPRTLHWMVKNKSLISYIECTFDLDSIKKIYITPNFKSKEELEQLISDRELKIPIEFFPTSYKPK